MGVKEDKKVSSKSSKQNSEAGYKKSKTNKKIDKSSSSKKWRSVSKWWIITLLVVFFPLGLYLLWRQDRWSKSTKKKGTFATLIAVVVLVVIAVIFAPPTVTLSSSLAPVKSANYHLTGTVSPSDSQVIVNGIKAKVNGDTFSADVKLKEGDNELRVVIVSGNKRAEKDFKIHRYTKSEILAQKKAAESKKKAKRKKTAVTKAKSATAAPKLKHSYDNFYAWLMDELDINSKMILQQSGFNDNNRYQAINDICQFEDSSFGARWTSCMQDKYKDYLKPSTFVGDSWMGDYSTMVGDMNYAGPKNDQYKKAMHEAQTIYNRLAVKQ